MNETIPDAGPERDDAIVKALGVVFPKGNPPYSTDEGACSELVDQIERGLNLRLKVDGVEDGLGGAVFLKSNHSGPFERVHGSSPVDAISAAALRALRSAATGAR